MLEQDLIPISSEKEQEVKDELAKYKMFGTVDQFIAMYNNGILSSGNEIVREVAKLLSEGYKNINVYNSRIIIESPAEVSIKNSQILLSNWQTIAKLKRLALTLLDEGYDPDTKIVFTQEKQGVPLIEIPNEETGEVQLVGHPAVGKVISRTSDLANNLLTRNILKDYANSSDMAYFNIEDFIDFNDEFIIEIEKMLSSNTFKG